jgi:DNA-binding SARP family transcriptional activator
LLHLTTLGTLSLANDGVPVSGPAAQRRKLALLAALAASPRGMSRDTLAALLWGEQDDERARHSLEQALYGLKHSLGSDPVQRTSTALLLDSSVVRADVAEFDAAIDAEEWERAAKAYGGGFLDGVFIGEAAEFERWSERERSRRRDAYLRALEQCARAATAKQAPDEAVWWWRRICQENPGSTRSTLGLARALVAAGEEAEALRVAEAHATHLAAERGAAGAKSSEQRDTAPQLTALLATLRGSGDRSVSTTRRATSAPSGADVMSLELSETLGDAYRIEGRVVGSRLYQSYRARQAQTGRLCVVKVLEPSIARFGDRRILLQHLERAVALAHDHLIGANVVGTTQHLVYLIGPDDDGETLRDRVRQRGELPIDDALSLAREVGSALAHAHAAGILHLDLTPKRILLTKRGAMLRDTGVVGAIMAASSGGSTGSGEDTNVVLGTAAFMSPEIALARGAPNELSDLFSFAAVVFHALTGALPFGASGSGAQPRPVPPSAAAIRPSVPRAVDAALARALSPIRSDRQASITTFLNELAQG